MPKRVTPEEIQEFYRLYELYGNFAEVGRRTGRSGSTVARYIQLKGAPQIMPHTIKQMARKHA